MKTQLFRFGFLAIFFFSLRTFAQAIIGGQSSTTTVGAEDCTGCWRMDPPINFYWDTASDPWFDDWTSWEGHSKGEVPENNYLVSGFVADMTVSVQPASNCSIDFWRMKAMKWIQSGQGASPIQNVPTDFTPVAGLEWWDFVDTTGNGFDTGIQFWRNRTCPSDWCGQRGTRVVALLAIRQTPEPVSLERIEFGSQSNGEVLFRRDRITGTGLGSYGPWNQGFRYGADRRKGTIDDSSVRSGPDYQGVDELYSLGFYTTTPIPVLSPEDLYLARDHFAGCQYYIFWYRVLGANTGRLLGELRLDVPVGYTWPIVLEMKKIMPGGQVFLDFQSPGNQQGKLYSSPEVDGPWTPVFDYPIWPGLYPVRMGTIPDPLAPKGSKLRVIEPARFFKIGQKP
jgi:hypothetical protein